MNKKLASIKATLKTWPFWRRILLFWLALTSSIILVVSLLVATNTGSRVAMNLIAKAMHWHLGDMKGNLLTGLDIEQIEKLPEPSAEKTTIGFSANKVSFRWQPLSLFYTSLNVQSLKIDSLRLRLPPSSESKPEWAEKDWPSLAQPLRVELHHLEVQRVQIEQVKQITQIEELKGSLSLGTFHLRVKPFQLTWNGHQLKAQGNVGLRYPYAGKFSLNVTPKQNLEQPVPIQFQADLTGDIKHFLLNASVQMPLRTQLNLDVQPALQTHKRQPVAQLNAQIPAQPLPEFLLPAPAGESPWLRPATLEGKIEASGWINQFSLAADLTSHLRSFDQTLGDLARAQLKLKSQGGFANAQTNSEFHWQVNNASLALMTIDKEEKYQSRGQMELSGDLAYTQQQIRSQLTAHFNALNLEAIRQDIHSEINGGLKVGMLWDADQKQVRELNLSELQIDGRWQNVLLNLTGNARYADEQWALAPLNARIGDNSLLLDGLLGRNSAVSWKLSAPRLQQLLPELSGGLQSTGSLKGDFNSPNINGQGELSQFVYKDIGMDKASWTATTGTADQKQNQPFTFNFAASHWQWKTTRMAKLGLVGQGNLADQHWNFFADSSSLGSVKLAWGARLVADSELQSKWEGNWQTVELSPKKMPSWNLLSKQPFALRVRKKTAKAPAEWQWELGQTCVTTNTQKPQNLAQRLGELPQSNLLPLLEKVNQARSQIEFETQPRICIDASQNDQQLAAHLDGDSIPLSQWQAWLKTDVVVSGLLMAKADLILPSARAGQASNFVLNASLTTAKAQLLYQFQGGETEVYPLTDGRVNLSVKGNQGKLSSQLLWGEYGAISGNVQWAGKDTRLTGDLSVGIKNLAPVEALLPFLNDVRGEANAKLAIGGNIDRPEFTGRMELNNGRANIPKLGLELKDAALLMTSQSDGNLQLDAQVTSGDGTLMLRGDIAHLGRPDWEWQSNIFGANIRAVDQPELIANISPNFKISANAQRVNLTGSTEIPWARSLLKTLPETATRISQDVTVVESKSLLKETHRSGSDWPFLCNFLIYFGDDVRFTGFGLDSLLAGKINVLKEPNRQTLTTGFVAVGQGKYKAYGQELNIERGRLIFQGPYDDPGLDIRALRVMENVSAGLDIGGTLQRPKSKVFSIPASSDSDAMALLLTGKTLSQSSQSDAYSILGAIGSLGMDRGSSMTADITRFFRLDELTVKSNKGLEQSALWMGKQITPKLFIRYMVGLFDQAFSLGMRYQINEKLRLEVESGKAQSVDVIYSVER